MRITVDLPMRISEDRVISSSLVLRVEADNWHDLLAICERPELMHHFPSVQEALYTLLSEYAGQVDPPTPNGVLRERYELVGNATIELDWVIAAPSPPIPTQSGIAS
jgi:hypothetical protein